MKRILVLNSGAAWAAYQIGALRHLVKDRVLSFDVCAGTGIGAMNAAFVACGAFDALERFWDDIGWLKLVSLNTRHPWRDAPLEGSPQARFISSHISEQRLEARGCTLVFNSLNLQTGREEIFTYPGSDVSLVEALSGAVAVPGMTAPYRSDGHTLVEGTFIRSFLLSQIVATYPAEEVYAVAALAAGTKGALYQRYRNWRQVMMRTLQLNLSRDVRAEVEAAERILAAARAHAQLRARLPACLAGAAEQAGLADQLTGRMAAVLEDSPFPYQWAQNARLYPVFTSRPIAFPMFSFQKEKLEALKQTGYGDAQAALIDKREGQA